MKTKNIFRMLLVAVTLLLGANNVKADETITLWTSPNGEAGTYFDGSTIELDLDLLKKISADDVIKFHGWVDSNEQQWTVGLYTRYNNFIIGSADTRSDPFTNKVASYTFEDYQVENLISYDWDGTEHACFIKGSKITLTSVEVVHSGKSNLGLAFTSSEVSVKMGETVASPALNNTDIAVTYSSGDTNIATVNAETGEVTPVSVGSTTITATFAGDDTYNEASASYKITVNKGTPTLSFQQAEYNATIGIAFTTPELYNPNNVVVNYLTYNTNLVEVDEDSGALTFKDEGTAEIIAQFKGNDNWNAAEAKYKVNITKRTPELSFPQAAYEAKIGEDFVEPILNNPNEVSVYYHSDNTYPAEVNAETGEITLKNPGEIEVVAKFDGNAIWKAAEAKYKLTVLAADAPAKADVTLSFSATETTATIGEEFTEPTLTATSGDQTVTGLAIQYSSSVPAVASVNASTGEVTLLTAGTTVITAAFGGDASYNAATSVSYTLTVNAAAQQEKQDASLTLGNVSLVFGANFAANITASTPTITAQDLTFTNSSDINVAMIVNGQVVPVGANSTTITASYAGNDSYNGTTATFELTVTAPAAPEGATSLGAVWLGDYARPIAEGSETKNGSQPTVESTVFTGIKKDDTVRIYGKIGPLDATNWDIQIWDKNWGANLISNTQTTCTTLAASGYADFVVPSDDVAEKLSTIGAVLNGRNVTVTAIQVIEGETPQPTYYTVTLDPDIVGGTVGMDSSNRQFEAGTVVEFWAEPAEGYELDYVSVTFVNARESKTEGNKTYFTFTMPSDDVTVTAIFNAVYVPPVIAERAVYIGSTGYATWTPDIAIDYGVVVQSGVKAYRADSKTTADGEAAILLKEITTKVPAHTPVLLIADATGTYTFSEGEGEATNVGNNLLRQGSDSYTAANDNYYVLTVSTTTGRVVFAQLKQSARIGSDKAYLDLTNVAGARSHSLSISFGDDGDDTTGINALERDTDLGNAAVYNLNGQRVEKPSKGLYIVNGKKVLIK